MGISISELIVEKVPNFKVGTIHYHDIVVSESPQMLLGRLQLFQESIQIELEDKSVTTIPGVNEWRNCFKAVGIDPSRYRPSVEALYRRIKKGDTILSNQSVVDINNFFSLEYEIPIGIYDYDKLKDNIEVTIGSDKDEFEGINQRFLSMNKKIVTRDQNGAFGSPIVDSKRTMVTSNTVNAIHIFYLKPSMSVKEANKLLSAAANMFIQIHGGTAEHKVILS